MTVVSVETVRVQIRVRGLVQGVGFRPFVHRVATEASLGGFVRNDVDGVLIEVEGSRESVERLVLALRTTAPPLARVDAIEQREVDCEDPGGGFAIVGSEVTGAVSTYVAPDAAVCDDCVRELFDPADPRYRYPFITCTNCGPRFTITTALPYDRANTTMASFRLCGPCRSQYEDPADRRFHAQPLACPACGPQLWFETGRRVVRGSDAAIATAQRLLHGGGIVAVKGIGGYHLACHAASDHAVQLLRDRKRRPDKPFAVMVRDLDVARRLTELSTEAEAVLTAPSRPIVLLPRREDAPVSESLAPGSPDLGILLPYSPLHHLLFAAVRHHDAPVLDALVMTSGNLSDEPLCYDDDDARRRLADLADGFLVHDRPIHVPCDDSVVTLVEDMVLPIRRSRGYAPVPISLPAETSPLLAVGGEMKNVFCLGRGRDAWLSQHLGDMGSVETLTAFERAVEHLGSLYDTAPAASVVDRHPGYHTTAWAERADIGPIGRVQHHHAHLAALLAEHAIGLDEVVLGVVFDGTGYGDDGTIWGGEFLLGGYTDVERVGHLAPVPLPGGDATIRRPFRTALAFLHDAGVPWDDDLAPVHACGDEELDVLAQQLASGHGCVASSSMGRLFDAVASLIGVRQTVTFEAQAAMELEQLARTGALTPARYQLPWNGRVIDPTPLIIQIVADLRDGVPAPAIAAGLHLAVVDAISAVVADVSRRRGVGTVGLSGGVFQNAILLSTVRRQLDDHGLRVLTHSLVPPNDGGLALGQAAVAAARCQLTRDTEENR